MISADSEAMIFMSMSAAPDRVDQLSDRAFFRRYPLRHYRLRLATRDETAALRRNRAAIPCEDPFEFFTIVHRARTGATPMMTRATFPSSFIALPERAGDEHVRGLFERMVPDAVTWFASTCRHPALVVTIEAGP